MHSARFAFTVITMIIALALFGCGKDGGGYEEFQEDDVKPVTDAEHDHEHNAPHGGQLIELGDHEYHAEVVMDHDEHKFTVYILDAHAEAAQAIDAKEITLNMTLGDKPEQFKLAAARQKTDPEGKSSRFELVDDELVHEFLEEEDAKGRLNVPIGDKSYVGIVAHKHDDDHEHEHGDDHDKQDGHDKDDDHEHADGDKDGQKKGEATDAGKVEKGE